MSDGLGFWSTAALSFTKTIGSVVDNVAVNIEGSIQAHERGDSQWAVVLGAAVGMVLPLVSALSGPSIKASRLGPYLTKPRLKAVGAAIFAVLLGLKLFGALESRTKPGGAAGGGPERSPSPSPSPLPSTPATTATR